MHIPTKTLHNGFSLPVLGFGTWTIGGKMEAETTHDETDIQALKQALDAGITHFDTAEKYAAGHAEELLGQAIKGYKRDCLFITSKVADSHLTYDDVLASCKASLQRLQTDYIDLYLIHAPNDAIPIEETMRALDRLKEEGCIKFIGVSNFTTTRLKEAQTYTKNNIVVNQVLYNLIYRQPEKDGLLTYCQENDIMLVAYRPVERGILIDHTSPLITALCQKYQKTPAQIAINWLTSQPNVVAISKMNTAEHLQTNIDAVTWNMENEDIEKLHKEFPNQQEISDTPMR